MRLYLSAAMFALILVGGYCIGSPRLRSDWRPFAIITVLSVAVAVLTDALP